MAKSKVLNLAGGGTYYRDGDTIRFDKDTPTTNKRIKTNESNYKEIADAINVKKETPEGNYLPSEMAPAIQSIITLKEGTSGDNAIEADILVTKKAHVKGKEVNGTMPDKSGFSIKLDAKKTSENIPLGKHDGLGSASIELEEKQVAPSRSQQTVLPSNGKVISKVTVDKIPDKLIDTTDANAIAGDIMEGKTAYIAGEKVTGSLTDGDSVQYDAGTPAETAKIVTSNEHYKSIVDAINQKIGESKQNTPAEIAPRISTIPETKDKSYGREAPTLEFDKTEILLGFDKKSDTFTIDTNSTGALAVESLNPTVATATLEGKTVTVESVNDTAGTATVQVKMEKTDTYLAAMKEISVSAAFLPTASIAPKSSVAYTNGLADIDPTTIALFGQAISNNAEITNTTEVVYIDFGDIHRKLNCGMNSDQVTINLNGTDYLFDIIGFNHDTLTSPTAYGSPTATGKAGITLQMHDLFSENKKMNSSDTNSGSWRVSLMRTQTMPQMRGYMPSGWQSVLKKVNKISGVGNGATSGTETTSDDLFLLSEGEIFGSQTKAFADEVSKTPQYAWYKAGNSKAKNRSGRSDQWWERSPYSGDTTRFCRVFLSGTADFANAGKNSGVAFGFCV